MYVQKVQIKRRTGRSLLETGASASFQEIEEEDIIDGSSSAAYFFLSEKEKTVMSKPV